MPLQAIPVSQILIFYFSNNNLAGMKTCEVTLTTLVPLSMGVAIDLNNVKLLFR
jgi:hypothetical protein